MHAFSGRPFMPVYESVKSLEIMLIEMEYINMNNEKRIIDIFFSQFTHQNSLAGLFYIGCLSCLFLILYTFQSYNYLSFLGSAFFFITLIDSVTGKNREVNSRFAEITGGSMEEIVLKNVPRKSTGIQNKDTFHETICALMEAADFDKETSELILHEFCGQAVKLIMGIKKHIAEQDFLEAGILLHQLKGSAGNVRAKKIAKCALEAEEALVIKDMKKFAALFEIVEIVVMAFVKNGKEEGLPDDK